MTEKVAKEDAVMFDSWRGFTQKGLSEDWFEKLTEMARIARGNILKMTTLAASGHPGLVPRRAKNGAGHLAEPATIAAGDFVVPFFDAHLLLAR